MRNLPPALVRSGSNSTVPPVGRKAPRLSAAPAIAAVLPADRCSSVGGKRAPQYRRFAAAQHIMAMHHHLKTLDTPEPQ